MAMAFAPIFRMISRRLIAVRCNQAQGQHIPNFHKSLQ